MRPRISSRIRAICFRIFRSAGLAESLTSALSSIAERTASSICLSGCMAAARAHKSGATGLASVPFSVNVSKKLFDPSAGTER